MTTGAILLGAALLLLTAIYVGQPLLRAPTARERRSQRLALLAQKEALLDQIRQLEFDHETGNVPADFFQAQRQALVLQAAQLLQELDQSGARDADAAIEQAVSALRNRLDPAPESGAPANFCPQCGQKVAAADRFCAYCGHHLEQDR